MELALVDNTAVSSQEILIDLGEARKPSGMEGSRGPAMMWVVRRAWLEMCEDALRRADAAAQPRLTM